MDLLSLLNAAVFGALSLVLVGFVISPRVRDGVIIKAGLIIAALGFGSIAVRVLGSGDSVGLERSLLMVGIGLSVVILWGVVRVKFGDRFIKWLHAGQVSR